MQPPEIIFEESAPYDAPLAALDLADLRRSFSNLFDRAARATCLAGYDLDDIVVERHLECQFAGEPAVRIPADHLSDGNRFVRHLMDSAKRAGQGDCSAVDVQITGLHITVVREQGSPRAS